MKSINTKDVKRVLIRGTNWVGDAVMSIPAMKEIRRIFPSARISLLVRPWVEDVYSRVDFIDETIEYDKGAGYRGWSGLKRLVADLKANRFDVAILLQNAFEAALIARLSKIPCRIGYARDARSLLLTHAVKIDPELRDLHQAHYYLALLRGAGLMDFKSWSREDFDLSIRIGVPEVEEMAARALLRSRGLEDGVLLIGLNPGATYGGAKRWYPSRYAEVADSLVSSYGARILLFGSAAERPIALAVAQKMKHPAVVLAGETTLGQLMALLKMCRLLVTNDSGPMHLAAALDVPQIAIFGSTSEIATGPLSARAIVLKHQVPCNPCFLRECPIDLRCMNAVTVAMVLDAAVGILSGESLTAGR